ncbi:MAG: thioredoxin [Saprospiraceae bacterium]|nr:thioredoxin [Saprospiraceae bacterium]
MDFKQDVIDKSFEKPVLVDFWAPWCSPCRVLGPTIEKLAEEQQQLWDLVKLNTEEEPQLSQQYGIRSIPNVKLFHKGEVIAEFSGALSRTQIQEWLDEHLPNEQKQEIVGLIEQLENGNSETVLPKLQALLDENPSLVDVRVAIARHLVWRKPADAINMVEDIKLADAQSEQAEDIRQIAAFLQTDLDDSPAGQHLAKAKTAAQQELWAETAQHLIDAVSTDRTFQEDLARKTGIALFRWLGVQHPVSKNYRWRFDMALY